MGWFKHSSSIARAELKQESVLAGGCFCSGSFAANLDRCLIYTLDRTGRARPFRKHCFTPFSLPVLEIGVTKS